MISVVNSTLEYFSLSGKDLRSATFEGSHLLSGKFINCQLSLKSFKEVKQLRHVELLGCTLDGTYVEMAEVESLEDLKELVK